MALRAIASWLIITCAKFSKLFHPSVLFRKFARIQSVNGL